MGVGGRRGIYIYISLSHYNCSKIVNVINKMVVYTIDLCYNSLLKLDLWICLCLFCSGFCVSFHLWTKANAVVWLFLNYFLKCYMRTTQLNFLIIHIILLYLSCAPFRSTLAIFSFSVFCFGQTNSMGPNGRDFDHQIFAIDAWSRYMDCFCFHHFHLIRATRMCYETSIFK